jgi:hypothetical protein
LCGFAAQKYERSGNEVFASEMRFGERATRSGFQILLKRERTGFIRKRDVGLDAPGPNFDVCDASPALCFCNRLRKSPVTPT